MSLIAISELHFDDIHAIWHAAKNRENPIKGNVAWSFEGNGIRTRTTFIQAFRDLGLSYTELPNLLKTSERPTDLAGYLDAFYDVYVIRETDHERLLEFSKMSRRPVINAMSSEGHPCEVLTDAAYIDSEIMPISQALICLFGAPTNVFRSWYELAQVLGIQITHVCHPRFHHAYSHVRFLENPPERADIVITDAWPIAHESDARPLSLEILGSLGNPSLLPTPPFTIGRELSFDPLLYQGFVGYEQKEWLLPIQRGILRFLLDRRIPS